MVNMSSASVSSEKCQKLRVNSVCRSPSLDQISAANKNAVMMDEDSDEDDEFQIPEEEVYVVLVCYYYFHLLLLNLHSLSLSPACAQKISGMLIRP